MSGPPYPPTPRLSPASLFTPGKSRLLVFYSSVEPSGRMWCPDCVRVDPIIKREIRGGVDTEEGDGWKIIRVGSRGEWKTPTNLYKKDPFNVPGVPHVILLPAIAPGTEYDPVEVLKSAPRLPEEDIYDPEKLQRFLGQR